jgi:hypothetical protein
MPDRGRVLGIPKRESSAIIDRGLPALMPQGIPAPGQVGLRFGQCPTAVPTTCDRRRNLLLRESARLLAVVSLLLTVTFACGVLIAVAHVVNRRFVAPVYDVVANITAFGCAVGASLLLGHPVPAVLSAVAILCWLVLARRTVLYRRERRRGGPR